MLLVLRMASLDVWTENGQILPSVWEIAALWVKPVNLANSTPVPYPMVTR